LPSVDVKTRPGCLIEADPVALVFIQQCILVQPVLCSSVHNKMFSKVFTFWNEQTIFFNIVFVIKVGERMKLTSLYLHLSINTLLHKE